MCTSSTQEYGQEVEDTAAAPVRCEGGMDCQCVFFGKGVQAVAVGDMKDYACLASGVDCYNAAPIIIGVNATISQRAFLCTAGHDITDPHHQQTDAPVIIKDRAWVCAEAFVGQGVTIGEGAVICPRGVVVKNVEPWTVVGGNPAKFIKMRKINEVLTGWGIQPLNRNCFTTALGRIKLSA